MSGRVIVIGAGAIGAATAYELASAGREVLLLDRDPPLPDDSSEPALRPRAASWAAAGILPPANLATATDPLDRLRGLSHHRFPSLASELFEQTGLDCELRRCGGWYLADTAGEKASMAGMVSYWRDLEIECEEKSLDDVCKAEPMLDAWCRRGQGRAWWVPDEYRIHCSVYVRALRQACASLGVDVRGNGRVSELKETESGVVVSLAGGDTLLAEQVAVCGGAWTGLVAERLRLASSIVPVRGQMLLMRPRGPSGLTTDTPTLGGIVNLGHRYLVPRLDGSVLIGSCEEEVGFHNGTTPRGLDELRQFVSELCPPLADECEVAAWSGLRPMTFDGFPMCGKLPDSDRIFVAAGHFRSGVHLSPGTARLLSDLINGNEPTLDLDAFRVGKQQD